MILNICIITPDQVFLNEKVEEVILPTNTGQMGILSNHAPLITALDIGVMLIRHQKHWSPIVIMGGFSLVQNNQVTVLVNEAEAENTINKEEAEQNFLIAKANFEKAETPKQKVETNFIYKRARARYQAIQ